jgi:hypothetical protein
MVPPLVEADIFALAKVVATIEALNGLRLHTVGLMGSEPLQQVRWFYERLVCNVVLQDAWDQLSTISEECSRMFGLCSSSCWVG